MGTVYATSKAKELNVTGRTPSGAPMVKPGACSVDDESKPVKTVSLDGVMARVDRVNFDGVSRTKVGVLQHSVRLLFTAQNFEDMIQKATIVREKLQSLGIFRNVAIHIDTSSGPKATPNGYEVTYEVVEMKRIFGGVTTQVANSGEAVLVVNGIMPNLFGNAESLKAEYTYGSNRTNTIGCSITKPLFQRGNPVYTLSGFKNDSEWPMSGYKVIDKAILLDIAWNSIPNLMQNLQYEADWRQIGAGNRYAAFEVREDSGHTLKSSIRHIGTVDYRDSKVFPTCGSLVKFISEYSGIGGNVSFLKNEGNLQFNVPFLRRELIFQLSVNLGHIHEFDNVAVCDNFFLGGPMSLRGFEFRSVGPSSNNNFTGGKMYWSSGLHLYTPLPFKPGSGGFGDLFRSHIWINCGNCGEWDLSNVDEFIKTQKESMRVAAGLGLAFRLGQMARVEINYCFPLHCQESDKKVEGVQFGVGVHFV
ncbi:hypothetical protein O3M35_009829 [Rhynocoris fuscipes]|uniref:Bacterial surface antigen (D15) domain-containing protein n=1 Tax=Rhynocoris fuscipes TaxID=488301 RepID=A0AAW1DA95_9HEMI